jgi:NTP pyrophosphatase (non-canonical NTP hydrolase)
MEIREFQQHIEELYGSRDRERGLYKSFSWLVEEMGELSRALRRDDPENLELEVADVAAWLVSIASIAGVDVEKAIRKAYGNGCPRCGEKPCGCPIR